MYKGRYKVSNVCQLIEATTATTTINGVTFTNNGDGTITANGTATANSTFNLIYKADLFTIIGHKYLLIGCPEGGNILSTYFLRYDSDGGTVGYDVGNGVIFTKTAEKIAYVNIRVYAGYTANNLIFKPQLFDLTEMYGAGNEPTTVAEFKEKFPDDLYPYSPCCWAKIKQMRYKVSNVCQLIEATTAIHPEVVTINGVTITNNLDGSWTFNGTSTDRVQYNFPQSHITGHTFLLVGNPVNPVNKYDMSLHSANWQLNDEGSGAIAKLTTDATIGFDILKTGITVNNLVVKPQLFDLTEMYGAGNEPTTVAQFKQDFPDDLYPYSPQCYLQLK